MTAINFAIGFVSSLVGFFSGYAMWLLVEQRVEKEEEA